MPSPPQPDPGRRAATSEGRSGIGAVVASAPLAAGALPALSEVEFGLTIANHAFQRWIVRCMAAAGGPAMSPLEVLILHRVNHRGRPQTLSDICLVLGVGDPHLANYAIRKLARHGLVAPGRRGKEKLVAVTPAGADLCARYRAVREALLLGTADRLGTDGAEMSRLATLLRTLSGSYDQAARAAAAL